MVDPCIPRVKPPTVGALSLEADRSVEVPITLPTLVEEHSLYQARVQHAPGVGEYGEAPDVTSGLWRDTGVLSENGSVFTDPRPRGSVVWVRARGEVPGLRPSGWTTPKSIEIPEVAGFVKLELTFDVHGVAVLDWIGTASLAGIRARWEIIAPEEIIGEEGGPLDSEGNVGGTTLGFVPIGHRIVVEVEAWDGFDSGSVAGELGDTAGLEKKRTAEPVTAEDSIFTTAGAMVITETAQRVRKVT